MNSAEQISLETIYGLLLNIDKRLEVVDRRLEVFERKLEVVEHKLMVVEQRLDILEQKLDLVIQKVEYLDKRLEKIEKRVDFVEGQQMEDRKMLMDIWRDREKVTITFSKTFAFFNLFIAGIVSGVVAFFTKQH